MLQINTTSPEKYFVHPNIGLIKPESTCNFLGTRFSSTFPCNIFREEKKNQPLPTFLTRAIIFFITHPVKIQAQGSEPTNMKWIDKFLIQSKTVPLWTKHDDVTTAMVRALYKFLSLDFHFVISHNFLNSLQNIV